MNAFLLNEGRVYNFSEDVCTVAIGGRGEGRR